MKKNVEKYLNNNLSMAEETAFEEKNIQEGFDFIERRANWNNVIADTFAEIETETAKKSNIRRLWQYAATALRANRQRADLAGRERLGVYRSNWHRLFENGRRRAYRRIPRLQARH